MIHWKKNLYVGPKAEQNRRKIIHRVSHGRKVPDLYLLALPANPKNNLDLIPWEQVVRQKAYPDITITGIAADFGEAKDLVLTITKEVYEATGTCDIREWLMQKD